MANIMLGSPSIPLHYLDLVLREANMEILVKIREIQEKLRKNMKFQSKREMVDKGRIVLGPPRRYPPPLSRGTRERQERHPSSCASRLSATCAKPPVCLLLASPV